MTAIDRLANRLHDVDGPIGLPRYQAEAVATFIYEDWLPFQLIGMKAAAELLGLATSNTLTMRLARGHDLGLAVKVDGQRITTVDAVEAYGEFHPAARHISDDEPQREEATG